MNTELEEFRKQFLKSCKLWENLKAEVMKLKNFQMVDASRFKYVDELVELGEKSFNPDIPKINDAGNSVRMWFESKHKLIRLANFFDISKEVEFFSNVFNLYRTQNNNTYILDSIIRNVSEFIVKSEHENKCCIPITELTYEFTMFKNNWKKENILKNEEEVVLYINKMETFITAYTQFQNIMNIEQELENISFKFYNHVLYRYVTKLRE